MRTRVVPLGLVLGLVVAAAPGAAIIHLTHAGAHGRCRNGHGDGGEGEVHVDPFTPTTDVDLLTVAEARSVANASAQFANGTAADASDGTPGDEDACPADDDPDDDGTEESEDHVSAHVVAANEIVVVGVCYDDEGFHTTSQCHGGAHSLPRHAARLP